MKHFCGCFVLLLLTIAIEHGNDFMILHISQGIHSQSEAKLVRVDIVCLNVLFVGLPDDVTTHFLVITFILLSVSL